MGYTLNANGAMIGGVTSKASKAAVRMGSLLEGDQTEDTEESASMNDDEINMIVARTEGEIEVFQKMDKERAAREEQEWHAGGNSGPVPPRLMTIEELPEIYQRDEPLNKMEDDVETLFSGRGARARNTVKYTDGMTDDQWAEALEDGTLDEPLTERKARSKARPPPNRIESSPELDEPGADDDDWAGANNASSSRRTPAKRARGRPRAASPIGATKRKRGGGTSKQPSPSPSLDDEDEIPESKRRKTAPAKGGDGISPQMRERMKKAFQECYRAVQACVAEDGRSRCDLFRELPNRKVRLPLHCTPVPH